jgi:6-hydroxytryprostatin B O-methyltransferase
VQDYKHTVEQGRDQLPACLLDRISFQAHDIFDPQPATAADVYILRHICHNWSDPQASTILRNLVPAMKPTSRILLVETVVVPPRGIERSLSSSPSGAMSALQERYMR